jgi:hypothetical protein
MTVATHLQTGPGAFYESLANTSRWRYRCNNCSCPKWAHAYKSSVTTEQVVVGHCACGRCQKYAPETQTKGKVG